jgi:hypothetical protein
MSLSDHRRSAIRSKHLQVFGGSIALCKSSTMGLFSQYCCCAGPKPFRRDAGDPFSFVHSRHQAHCEVSATTIRVFSHERFLLTLTVLALKAVYYLDWR